MIFVDLYLLRIIFGHFSVRIFLSERESEETERERERDVRSYLEVLSERYIQSGRQGREESHSSRK